MPSSAMRGQGVNLPYSNVYAVASNEISIPAGGIYNIPAGGYVVETGSSTFLQYKDPVINDWRTFPTDGAGDVFINADGGNYRLANLSGTIIGGVITAAGSGYTNGVFVSGVSTTTGLAGIAATPSAGGSTFTCIVGGAINTTVTITAGGTLYTAAPTLIVSAPPAGGLQATATCTISGGIINAVTVTNQGAGYLTAPTITVVNFPGDTTGSGAVLTVNATLVGSGTLTGIYPNFNGSALTAVPTLSFSAPAGTSAAATSIMNFVATGITLTNAGVAYSNSVPFTVITAGGISTATSVLTNPNSTSGLTVPRQANFVGSTTAGGIVQTAGLVTVDGGLGFQTVPTGYVLVAGTAVATTGATVTMTVGGKADTSTIQPV